MEELDDIEFSIQEAEGIREDADDFFGAAVDHEALPDDLGIGPEVAVKIAEGEEHCLRSAGLVIFTPEEATVGGDDAEQGQSGVGDDERRDLVRLGEAGDANGAGRP